MQASPEALPGVARAVHEGVHPPVVKAVICSQSENVSRASKIVLATALIRRTESAEVAEVVGAVAFAAKVGAGHAHCRIKVAEKITYLKHIYAWSIFIHISNIILIARHI
jgi:hypothetical protein